MTVETPHPVPNPPAVGRWIRVILFTSLALNLLFAGFVGGNLLTNGPGKRASMVRELNFGPFTEALSREQRSTLRRAFVKIAPDMAGERQNMRRDLGVLLVVLRAAAFDRAAMEVIFAGQRDQAVDRLTLGQKLVLDLVSAMTPADRSAFADRLERVMSRRKGEGAP